MTKKALLFAAMSILAAGCSGNGGETDGGVDAGVVDAGTPDAGTPDAGTACTPETEDTACGTGTQGIYSACGTNGVCSGTCTGSMGSTSNCLWGDECGAGGTGLCAFTSLASCDRASHAPQFTTTGKAPLIVAVTASGSTTSDTNNECAPDAAGNPDSKVEATITFDAPNGLTSASTANTFLDHVKWINSNGNAIKPAFVHNRPPANATSGTFTVGVCSISTISGGAVYLVDDTGATGNAACFSAQ